jgi:hypothetical protein
MIEQVLFISCNFCIIVHHATDLGGRVRTIMTSDMSQQVQQHPNNYGSHDMAGKLLKLMITSIIHPHPSLYLDKQVYTVKMTKEEIYLFI